MGVARVLGVGSGGVHLTVNNNGSNETVNTQDTSHNDRNDRSHHEIGPHNTHGADADTRLSGT